MKQKLIFLMALMMEIPIFAETNLVIYPIDEAEKATMLSTIGYIKLRNDSISIFSKDHVLLGKNSLSIVHKIMFRNSNPIPTELDDIKTESSILVYPNPTQDALVIQNADCDMVRVFNMNGQILLSMPIHNGSGTLNVSSLPTGTYILQLNTEFVKFIKQ